jgi:cyclopropane-fatty-acyl-phospholipid synthase
MLNRNLQATVETALAGADVRVNGERPCDIQVHDPRFYSAVLSHGALGMGESYMDGWWDCADLAGMFCRLLKAQLDRRGPLTFSAALAWLNAKLTNRQGKRRSAANVRRHYDQGNELYRNMLGRWMLYSSANWHQAANLDEAGEAKYQFICGKLQLHPGQRLLDIGCGWGGLAKYAAQTHGVHVVGITLSHQQIDLARHICADLPVEFHYQDYRELHGVFDHVVSLGMFEHVGPKNYRRYMKIVRGSLKPSGLFFLNTIGANESGHALNPWSDKYIFPGAVLPSMAQIGAAIDGIFSINELTDWAGFYDRTLLAWFERFHANWSKLQGSYGEQFYRMWKYYLLSSAGAFRARKIHDWQIVLSC